MMMMASVDLGCRDLRQSLIFSANVMLFLFFTPSYFQLPLVLIVQFHEVCLDESVKLTVHHSVNVRRLIVGAVILHTAVVKNV